jgi:hydroxymethylpyrimidine/phosphomethylpyrimidine kinase
LICAGLDPSGGAGLIADVRVVDELGARPVGVVTALTVQNTTAVIGTEAMNAEQIREQLEFLLSDIEVHAVKIGMIGSSEVAKSIAHALALTSAPVVWDPIIHPSRGDVPFVDSLFNHAIQALLPHVTVLTPNIKELAFLTGAKLASLGDAIRVGQALAVRLGTAVLVKGGHLAEAMAGDPARAAGESPSGSSTGGTGSTGSAQPAGSVDDSDESIDILCSPRPGPAGGIELLRGPRLRNGHHVHGTGCALSSAIATHLARGFELVDACRAAKAFVAARIAAPVHPGRGADAIV